MGMRQAGAGHSGCCRHVAEFEFLSAGNGEPRKGSPARETHNLVSIFKGGSGSWETHKPESQWGQDLVKFFQVGGMEAATGLETTWDWRLSGYESLCGRREKCRMSGQISDLHGL